MPSKEEIAVIKTLAARLGDSSETDFILMSAGIIGTLDREVIATCSARRRRKNVMVILVTGGGKAEIAYRISRCFQERYSKFTILIPAECKSAGTIICLGAHELVIGDLGELGPLDVQLAKADELWEYSSGLIALDALDTLQQRAFRMFEQFLLDLKLRSKGQITLKTAAEISSTLVTGLYGNIYGQIDPIRLGENSRSINVSIQYGDRLGEKGKNLKDGTVAKLTVSYPSHDFVIDREEAKTLFKNVRVPMTDEIKLLELLGDFVTAEKNIFDFLTSEPPSLDTIVKDEEENGKPNNSGNGSPASEETTAGTGSAT